MVAILFHSGIVNEHSVPILGPLCILQITESIGCAGHEKIPFSPEGQNSIIFAVMLSLPPKVLTL